MDVIIQDMVSVNIVFPNKMECDKFTQITKTFIE